MGIWKETLFYIIYRKYTRSISHLAADCAHQHMSLNAFNIYDVLYKYKMECVPKVEMLCEPENKASQSMVENILPAK